MSDINDKNLDGVVGSDGVARAKLFSHLAHKGYVVTERDDLGPLKVLVNSMGLQEWERDGIVRQSGGKGAGRVKDYIMRFVSQTDWRHD